MEYSGSHTFVTIVFDQEIPLLKIQARSFERFVPDNLVKDIYIIYNSPGELPKAHQADIRTGYGRHGSKITFWTADEICAMPMGSGWDRQQILKLAVANRVRTEHYTVLDAKSHLAAPLTVDFLQTSEGKQCANCADYTNHALRYALTRAFKYFKIDIEPYISKSLDTITPFTFYTKLVSSMMQDLAEKENTPFSAVFLKNGFAEFTLYSAWLNSNGYDLDDLYHFHQIFPALIWDDTTSFEYVEKMIREIEEKTPFISVHRRAYGSFDEATVERLATFWVERGLFESTDQVKIFVSDFSRSMRKGNRKERMEQILLKPLYLFRRLNSRIKQIVAT
jgi:hypothetical protein